MTEAQSTTIINSSSGIDWTAIYRRLEKTQQVLEQRNTFTVEEKTRVLQARAKDLAREADQELAPLQELEVVEFLLAYERYAVGASWVREVYPLRNLTPLPGTPAFVAGIVNVRGQILAVIDLKKFFDLPPKGLPDFNKLIILSDGQMEFGLLVDMVIGVHSVPLQTIQASLPMLTGVRATYLYGVTGEHLIILDAKKIMADPKIIVQDDMKS